jgi:hypothetical protein
LTKPQRGDSAVALAPVAPLGLFARSVVRFPGVCTPGYTLSPLPGLKSTFFRCRQQSQWVSSKTAQHQNAQARRTLQLQSTIANTLPRLRSGWYGAASSMRQPSSFQTKRHPSEIIVALTGPRERRPPIVAVVRIEYGSERRRPLVFECRIARVRTLRRSNCWPLKKRKVS